MNGSHLLSGVLAAVLAAAGETAPPSDPFKITVIDGETRRGVPLVELSTTGNLRSLTDSNGIVAFHEPALMGERVYFHVKSHGYEFPRNFLGDRALTLDVTSGGSAVIELKRLNVAERLYRVTGEGIYRDSLLVGQPAPTRHPLLNGKVVGQDTVIAAPYRGKIYWFWGDTIGPASFNFSVSGATSEGPGKGGLAPDIGIDLTYFVDGSGFAKAMCAVPTDGLKWLEGLMTLKDAAGAERLLARYAVMKGLDDLREWGLAIFDDEKAVFERLVKFDPPGYHRSAHPFRVEVDGKEHYYIFPNLRVRADLESLKDLGAYEAFTPLVAGSRHDKASPRLDRSADGRLLYAWKKGTDPLHEGELRDLKASGRIHPGEAWLCLHDMETGAPIEARVGSVAWNPFRGRWVMLAEWFGQVWYSEGDTPVGPWVYARKVVTHDRYSFYNVTQHAFFDEERGRRIYFEGTYTAEFSGSPEKTPRYDYNQVLYRLHLDDPRLFLPAPVYRARDPEGGVLYIVREEVESRDAWDQVEEIAFFALPPGRSAPGTIPFRAGTAEVHVLPAEPAEGPAASPHVVPLHEYRRAGGSSPILSTRPDLKEAGLERSPRPVCRVWRNPMSVLLLDGKAKSPLQ